MLRVVKIGLAQVVNFRLSFRLGKGWFTHRVYFLIFAFSTRQIRRCHYHVTLSKTIYLIDRTSSNASAASNPTTLPQRRAMGQPEAAQEAYMQLKKDSDLIPFSP